MTQDTVLRRLSAILAADVAGYSRLMAADETGTLARFRQIRAEVIDPIIAQFQGRIVGTAGDSLLVEFTNALAAVECAVACQRELNRINAPEPEDRRISFRMGVNLGDIIAVDDTIHGDGVNVASRLEKLAEPGGLCIARNVYEQVKGKIVGAFADLGEQRFHNIPEPVRAYSVRPTETPESGFPGLPTKIALSLPDKPSIAVLPFQNMSGDPEQEYFADGMVEEIITALSHIKLLFVIARNSSFTYRGRTVDAKQIGRELGVRYLLEGSVRKAGNLVRITGQLIDAATGAHLWADRFDGAMEDIFDLQDQVTASVVGAIAPKLEQAEIERTKRKPTQSLDAYDYYLRGMAAMNLWTREGNREAQPHFLHATELDPGFATAYGMAARCYSQRKAGGWATDNAQEITEAARLARRAAELGKDDALALATAGITLAYVVGDLDDGAAFIDQALVLNPNLAWAWLFGSYVKVWRGEPEGAIECVTRAMRLSPNDPQFFNMQVAAAGAHFVAGRYDEAVSWAEKALRGHPEYILACSTIAASAALAGRLADAERAVARMHQFLPQPRISDLMNISPLRRPEDRAKWIEGLRKAGLPE